MKPEIKAKVDEIMKAHSTRELSMDDMDKVSGGVSWNTINVCGAEMTQADFNKLTTMKERKLTLADLEKATGGTLDTTITDHLDEVIHRAKLADKTMEQCIQDFYRYNKDFTPEHEAYIRENWNQVK